MTITAVDERLTALEAKATRLRILCLSQLALVIVVCFVAGYNGTVQAKSTNNILRVRGLVIEDAEGKSRILIGAPFPKVQERYRQDSTTTAIVFLDPQGHDRLTLGEEPEPQVGGKVIATAHRIAPGFGVVIHDGEGNERGAYGWLANGRALITLDRPGLDAWAAVVDDKTGFAGIRIEYPPGVAADSNGIELGTNGGKASLRLLDTRQKERAVLQYAEGGATTFQTFDAHGKVIRDVTLSKPGK